MVLIPLLKRPTNWKISLRREMPSESGKVQLHERTFIQLVGDRLVKEEDLKKISVVGERMTRVEKFRKGRVEVSAEAEIWLGATVLVEWAKKGRAHGERRRGTQKARRRRP